MQDLLLGMTKKREIQDGGFIFLKIGIFGVQDASETIPPIRLYYLHQS
jgi:hypothetical protein